MNTKFFIDRPVLSTVISVIILLIGFLGLQTLPVTQYPDIAPPSVMVTASYPGANAETMRESVIIPIEEKINGVDGMTYITSTATNDGSASITVFFEQGVDPDIAAVNVQNRVSMASGSLPAMVTRNGVITEKVQNSAIMYVSFRSENPDYDETFVTNYLNINVKPQIQRVNGVSRVSIFGARDYSMRVWLSPEKMANYGLSVNEVLGAIQEQSKEVATGALGQNNGQPFEYVIKYKGRYKHEAEYENIVVKSTKDGRLLRLKDVAEVELDAFSYSGQARTNGNPSTAFGIYQTPGSNAQKIAQDLYTTMERIEKQLPEGLSFSYDYDTNRFLEASLGKVKSTLYEAFLLVFIVVFLFLQNVKSTIIPAIAVPVAIIGTFFFLKVAGYSLNLLTLFALILAIGIVVDDAIVVVEAVHAKLEEGYKSAREATITAMNEISGAIVSITLVMAAVFIPVTFIDGPSGIFYKQFGVTLIIAILISALNALTLSPALSALFLKPHEEHEKKSFIQRFYMAFNAGFESLTNKYIHSLKLLFKHKWISGFIILLSVGVIYYSQENTPTGFVPAEDQGVIFINVELPEGASADRSFAVTEELRGRIEKIQGVDGVTLISGNSFFSGAGSSYAMGFIKLSGWDERKEEHMQMDAILGQLFGASMSIADASIIFFTPPSVPGFGESNGVSAQLVDQADGSLNELNDVANSFVGKVMAKENIAFVSNSFNTKFPQYQLDLNVDKAKEAGVNIDEIFNTVQGYIGGIYAADFSRFGKQFKVMVQSKPKDRSNEQDLNSMMVKNSAGKMAPITEFVTLKKVNGPQSIKRFNLNNTVALNAMLVPGASSGRAIKTIEKLAEEELPGNYKIKFSGMTREEIIAGNKTTIIFVLSLVFVYFLLAAQYESYILPLSVIISMVVGVAGAYFTNMIRGQENNIFFQIALIMLIGLLAKNAILIVEFSLQRRRSGMKLIDAAIEGARMRLRPILMTSFAFIVGLLPLVFAGGVGAQGNRSIGTGAAGGMFIGTVIGILIIPTLFVFFQYLQEKVSTKKYEIEKQ
ncbi:efflux RND transporter permease subunit [Prolixibacteraceae bacterium JC049]|nr:efflux RND transporter permease subunit [Prolixibacteraceae bacterium JC049]